MSHLVQIQSPIFTDKELKEYLKNCTTSFAKIEGTRVQYRECAMLDSKAQPIPIESFMVKSRQRVMLVPIEKPYRRHEEYLTIQSAKKEWNKANKGRILLSTKVLSNLRLLEDMSNSANN